MSVKFWECLVLAFAVFWGSLGALALAGSKDPHVMRGDDKGIQAMRLPPQGSSVYGVFEGKVPCADCNKTKVALTLHQDSKTGKATRYLLERIGVGKGDDRHVSQGTWKRASGSKFGNGLVLLDAHSPEEFRSYLAIGKDILVILDKDGNPRVGNATYSFTLSRTGPKPESRTENKGVKE